MVGRCGHEHEVAAGYHLGQAVHADRGPSQFLRELAGPLEGPVGDEDRAGAFAGQVLGDEPGHVARSDDRDVLPLEGADLLLSELYGSVPDRHSPLVQLRLGPDLLADDDGVVEQRIEHAPDMAFLLGLGE